MDFKGLDKLKNALANIAQIPVTQWPFFVSQLRLRTLEKDEYFFSEGDEVYDIGFIVKGLAYNYYVDSDGKELVRAFRTEGHTLAAYSNLITHTRASFYSRALEKTHLITIAYSSMEELFERHACWQKVGRVMAENLFILKEQRELDLLKNDARTRYELFVKENPTLVDRVPQYLIASFLGVSPVTLSRIRSAR